MSPPAIGEIYREFVEFCYKQNLLVQNRISIEDQDNVNTAAKEMVVSLKINMPFLNVVAEHDDLVEPNSSMALNNILRES